MSAASGLGLRRFGAGRAIEGEIGALVTALGLSLSLSLSLFFFFFFFFFFFPHPPPLDDQHTPAPLCQRRHQRANHLQLARPAPNRRVTSRWPPTSKKRVEGPTRCPVYHCWAATAVQSL